jgi:hypothetical protein
VKTDRKKDKNEVLAKNLLLDLAERGGDESYAVAGRGQRLVETHNHENEDSQIDDHLRTVAPVATTRHDVFHRPSEQHKQELCQCPECIRNMDEQDQPNCETASVGDDNNTEDEHRADDEDEAFGEPEDHQALDSSECEPVLRDVQEHDERLSRRTTAGIQKSSARDDVTDKDEDCIEDSGFGINSLHMVHIKSPGHSKFPMSRLPNIRGRIGILRRWLSVWKGMLFFETEYSGGVAADGWLVLWNKFLFCGLCPARSSW